MTIKAVVCYHSSTDDVLRTNGLIASFAIVLLHIARAPAQTLTQSAQQGSKSKIKTPRVRELCAWADVKASELKTGLQLSIEWAV